MNLCGSRKLSRLNSSRILLFKGVPVKSSRWTVLSFLKRAKMREPSDLTVRVSRSYAMTYGNCHSASLDLRRCPSSTHSTSHRGILAKTVLNSDPVIMSYVVKTMCLDVSSLPCFRNH